MQFEGIEVQKDPYTHLLSQQEKQMARCLPFRLAFNSVALVGTSLYYMSRHNELARVRQMRVSYNLVIGLAWRLVIAAAISDQVSRRFFVNYSALRKHKMADLEVKKVMRTFANARPMTGPNHGFTYFYC